MQIINNKNVKSKIWDLFITVQNDRLYFPQHTTKALNLKPGLFVFFINDEKQWSFFVNNDKDGFVLSLHKSKTFATQLFSVPLMNLLRKSYGDQLPKKFYLLDTKRKHNNSVIYELLIR